MSKLVKLNLVVSILLVCGHSANAVTLAAAQAQCQAQVANDETSANCTLCGCTSSEQIIYYSGTSGAGRVTEVVSAIPMDDYSCNPAGIFEFAGETCEFSSGSTGTQIPLTNSCTNPVRPANSSINIDNLSVTETTPLVGVPFSLNYSSARTRATSTFSPQILGLGGWTPTPLHYFDSSLGMIYYGNGDIRLVTAQTMSGGGYYATDEAGTEVYYFDTNGKHTQTKDAVTGAVKYNFTYNTNGTLASIADQFSNTTTFVTSSGNVVMTSPYGQATTLTFDSQGLLASVVNPNGETYTITNDDNGFLSTFTKPLGQFATMTYDSNGYITTDNSSSGSSLGLNYSFSASTHTQVVNAWDALGNSTQFTTVAATNTSSTHSILDFVGMTQTSSDVLSTSHADTDGYGNAYGVTYSTDPRFGNMVSVPATISYTVPSSSISLSSALTQSATLSTPSDPFSFTTLTQNLTLQGDATRVFSSVYNKTANTLTSTSPLSRTVTETLNSNGQPSSIQVGSLTAMNISYDTHGRLSTITQGTRTSTITYDSHSNIASSTDALGHQTQYSYDASNRVTLETLPDSSQIAMTYDANGNLTSVTPPGKTAHSMMYNNYDWMSEYLAPSIPTASSSATTYTYYPNGKLNTISLPSGDSIQYAYDYSTERLTSINLPIGAYSLTYFTNSDLVNTITAPSGETSTYTYAGNIPTSIVASGPVASALQFSFNTDGSVSSIAVGPNTSTLSSIALGYDKDGLLTSAGDESLSVNSFGATSASSIGLVSESVGFNSFGEPTSDNFNYNTSTALTQSTYTRDDVGHVDALTRTINGTASTLNYDYDSQGHLTSVDNGTVDLRIYAYDANGNRTSVTNRWGTVTSATFNAQDQLLTYGATTYQYDGNGNLSQTSYQPPASGGVTPSPVVTTYAYDVMGNLKAVTLPSGDVITYIIDGQNRRVGKNLNGTLVQGFIYQSQTQIAAELDGSGNVVKQFIYGTKSNIPDYMIYGGNKYRIISDQVGTPQLIVNTQTGAVLEQPVYDEFGVPAHGQTSSVIPFGFAGGIMDYDVKLVRMGARDYDPYTGRFISKDPIGFGGGMNQYVYSINDPINYIDPTGKSPWGLIIGALAGVFYSTDTDTPGAAQAEMIGVPLNVATGFSFAKGLTSAVKCPVSSGLQNGVADGFTEHGLQRAAERGISNSAIDSAINNSLGATAGAGRYGNTVTIFGSNGINVVMSTSGENAGKIITVYTRGL